MFTAAIAAVLAWVVFAVAAGPDSAEALGTQPPVVRYEVAMEEANLRVTSARQYQDDDSDFAKAKLWTGGLELLEDVPNGPQPTCRNVCVKWHRIRVCDIAGNCTSVRFCCKREWKCDYYG